MTFGVERAQGWTVHASHTADLHRAPVVIPDVHGRSTLLACAIRAFPGRRFVLLGDYFDRGPDSPGVLRVLRALHARGRAICLMGNHDQMALEAVLRGDRAMMRTWIANGGRQTIAQFGTRNLERALLWMDQNLRHWHIESGLLFAHAARPSSYDFPVNTDHLWHRPGEHPLHPLPPGCRLSLHGHTPQEQVKLERDALYLDLGMSRLVALDLETRRLTIFR
ncbi:hypothetical protein HNR42_003365 [Deinobacterium chartae]|uniref:Calcineurin-like phosphoesterase domain-containing protein n=1 Tax=Deinobacterium chartae TaxID=521158 RepID=A0A841I7X4_9DEIO|nr:metallophosphoesterase [Deinobacterium chartae]MBB6099905.1 hypothetical protein [Deinobacterium chartae]